MTESTITVSTGAIALSSSTSTSGKLELRQSPKSESKKRKLDTLKMPPLSELCTPAGAMSVVWEAFRLPRGDSPARAWCLGCESSFAYHSTTSNLSDHLKACSGGLKRLSEQQQAHFMRPKVEKDINGNPFTKAAVARMSKEKQVAIEQKLIRAVVHSNFATCCVDTLEFREFIAALNPSFELPHRTKLTNMIDDAYSDMEESVGKLFAGAESISLTSDSATTVANDSVEAVTAHFIDKSWRLRSVLIALYRLDTNHTGTYIKTVIDEVSQQWKLSEKLFGIATGRSLLFNFSPLWRLS